MVLLALQRRISVIFSLSTQRRWRLNVVAGRVVLVGRWHRHKTWTLLCYWQSQIEIDQVVPGRRSESKWFFWFAQASCRIYKRYFPSTYNWIIANHSMTSFTFTSPRRPRPPQSPTFTHRHYSPKRSPSSPRRSPRRMAMVASKTTNILLVLGILIFLSFTTNF